MIETDSVYVIRNTEELGIPDERLIHILKAAEEIRSRCSSRNEILEYIYGFSEEDNKESVIERLMMAYFAGNQSKNPRKIKRFAVHKKNLE